jgi:formamidopyrimidine-DNA glycosylase
MPELPDLEVFAENLHKRFKNKSLKSITVGRSKNLSLSVKELEKAIVGVDLIKIYRKGKTLELEFKNKNFLELHLMLNGEIKLMEEGELVKYSIIDFIFNDGKGFSFTDFQGMARATLNPEAATAPDAFDKEMDQAFFKQLLSKKRGAIKQVLLDQKSIRGIGNAYADEILWDARISPISIAKAIPEKAVEKLFTSLKKVLKEGVKSIKKIDPDIVSGEIRDFMKVHQTKNSNSPTGSKIIIGKVGSKKTYYTDEQEVYE